MENSAMEIIKETRAMVWEWSRSRGPVFGWSAVFAAEFQAAEQNGTLQILANDWQSHRDVGKALLQDLQGFVNSHLPKDEKLLRDLIRQALDLISTLLAGIAMVEAHLTTLYM
jgi:hypothetical protein